jgi:hypothetical protein
MNIMTITIMRPMKPIKLELTHTSMKIITIIMMITKMGSNTKPKTHTIMKTM